MEARGLIASLKPLGLRASSVGWLRVLGFRVLGGVQRA